MTTYGLPNGEPGEARVMAGPERIEWRRAFPSRAVTVLVWYVVLAGLVLGLILLLFGDEPAQLDDGEPNPLVAVLPIALVLAVVGAIPVLLVIVRRPMVAANHYALTVRPGAVRTLVLPWARITFVVVRRVGRENYLLVRCRRELGSLGDHPTWLDQSVLRAVLRTPRGGSALAGEFDLAVLLRDFVGEPNAQLATLAAFAPDHVLIASDVEV
jgi:hypothetical protein